MKKTFIISLLAVITCALLCFVGCTNTEDDGPAEITGITFNSLNTVYDGTEKEILISGQLPEGVTVTYHSNKATNPGTYNATATLTGENYKEKTLTATLFIDKMEITGVTFDSINTVYDGTEKEILISGQLPEGVTVAYLSNKATDAGTYNATATLKGKNYKEKTLTATLFIDKADIAGITFADMNTVYDGQQKEILVSGQLPTGVTATYSSNRAINAGTYNATATLAGKNYKGKTLHATLFIDKATITGITLEKEQSVMFDDANHLPIFNGTLPQGISVTYKYNNAESKGVRAVGKYAFSIEFSGTNYKTLVLDCLYKIKMDYTGLAEAVFAAFGNVPKPWSFLPEAFAVTSHTINATPNFTNFVNVATIPTNGIGKQMDVVYGLLNKSTVALSYVNKVYEVFNTIKAAYSTFFDNDPDDYTVFTKTIGVFNITIRLDGNKYLLSTSVSGIGIKIFADTETKSYGARVQLTSSLVLKYTCSENRLLLAMNLLETSGTQVEFVRGKDNNVTGYLYETLVANDKTLNETCALLTVNNDYTTIIGTKGDFIPLSDSRNVEVYSSQTGKLVGTEVREKISISGFTDMYDTLWYPLGTIGGIKNIKKEDKANGTNPDKIWINDNTDTIHTTLVGGISKKTASRRYDIEFKEMCFYKYNAESAEYEKVVYEIPMMFIQEQQLDNFEKDFKNSNNITVTLNVTASVKNAVNHGYYELLPAFDKIKGLITLDSIVKYCEN